MARLTYRSIIDGVRVLLNDTDSVSKRYTDAVLIGILNRALSELERIRPDALFDLYDANDLNTPLVVDGTPDADYDEAGLDDEFPLDRMFQPPLIEYVAGMAEAADDEFAVDGRAVLLLERFRASLQAL